MSYHAHDAYLESRILSADPLELTRLLFQSAMEGVRDARHYLASGDIALRTRAINKSSGILLELAGSLDYERGGEISVRLAQLYDYMLRQLTTAHLQQSDGPLVEVLGLLATLAEGWEGIRTPEPAESAWTAPLQTTDVPVAASHGWSF